MSERASVRLELLAGLCGENFVFAQRQQGVLLEAAAFGSADGPDKSDQEQGGEHQADEDGEGKDFHINEEVIGDRRLPWFKVEKSARH